MLEWLATISDRHADELRRLQAAEAEARDGNSLGQCHGNGSLVNEAWVPSQHPRLGGQPNAGYFASTGGSAGSMVPASTALAGVEADPDDDRGELTVTPSMIRASGWLGTVREKMRLARDVAGAFAAGLGTGAKAVVNGLATGTRSVATLGLNTDQLELIGVTKEDRERGYDTAVTISTGSGQLLIAVGTGGMTSALAKGGTIARAASGALIAYDAAGNAVGVVQGVLDAEEKGLTLANGTKVAASALGISANISAAKGLLKPRSVAPPAEAPPRTTPPPAKPLDSEFRVGKHGDMPSPRPGQHSHHGVMSEWVRNHYPGYDPDKAPAILMPKESHIETYRVYNSWRAQTKKEFSGAFDWAKIDEDSIRDVSEKMFDAAKVPASVRERYWTEFERMKAALERQRRSQSLERGLARESLMNANADILTDEQMRSRYGRFYEISPRLQLDRRHVPMQFWPLLPYAEFWGFADDWTRQDLVRRAPPDVQRNLKEVLSMFDDALDEWLAGPEVAAPKLSDEYVAFTALRMAADFA
jgi:hypothetical protein